VKKLHKKEDNREIQGAREEIYFRHLVPVVDNQICMSDMLARFLRAFWKNGWSEMMRSSVIWLALTFSLHSAMAEDFRKTYSIPPGGQILIGNILGSVKVKGYKGNNIEVVAHKKGPERDQVEIQDQSAGNRIDLRPIYPQFHSGNTTVDFELRVPSSIAYNFSRLSSFSGDVEVSNVMGGLRAESVRGNVDVRAVRGMVSASSVSGNVNVEIDQAEGRSNMRFSSISGNISVRAPAGLDALIDMSSMSGLLKTDFPIEIQERRYGPGLSARGRLGNGKQILHMTSVSGIVSLNQR